MASSERRVLCVGLVCLDIVKTVSEYPLEDSAQRCLECERQRGGNASNTSSVLGLLGESVEFFGTVAQSSELSFLEEDFASYGVQVEHVIKCPDTDCPLSVVIVNRSNGSRTILHTNKNLRELTVQDLEKVDLSSRNYKWIHFECRPTVPEIEKMLLHVGTHNKNGGNIMTSLELEKPRDNCESLYSLPDVIFLSKEFAQHHGYSNMEDAVTGFSAKLKPGAAVICAWGEMGAAAKRRGEPGVITVPALKLEQVVDTLAAGDTFNAGTIFAMSRGASLRQAIVHGCKVAGTKCGMKGLKGLEKLKSNDVKWH